ncbi:hypothetical protein FHX37_2620 [Haloactinospora alba]|uniref:3'-phosphoadenosine 5'-phosphosulfate sulfotransferase (PAPS reductase)/FAD synthetase n=1 Tax=Haloactinospora alba TaxID=405555 RepID=A0A543NLC9_9ACTN|nr:hypothetical protein [Haloactinospora alba]TQN32643.1 hypothetical protein FHX37_2620 [Haloactinospora alba]
MHTGSERHGTTPLRLLLLDGTPGATTLLVLAAHGALPRPDAALIPDTGWYPTSAYEYLDRLAHLATGAGIEVLWADAGAVTAATAFDPSTSCPLPLHTRAPDGTPGRLANGCAARQREAIDDAGRDLLGGSRAGVEFVLGLCAEQADLAHPAAASYRRNRYPLVELGWRTENCLAHLAQHDLAYVPDMACIGCPNRTNAGWAELRATDPQAWQEALAVDDALRNHPATVVPGGMPPGTTGYLHPAHLPLAEVELDAATDAGTEACVPRACRGTRCSQTVENGGGT